MNQQLICKEVQRLNQLLASAALLHHKSDRTNELNKLLSDLNVSIEILDMPIISLEKAISRNLNNILFKTSRAVTSVRSLQKRIAEIELEQAAYEALDKPKELARLRFEWGRVQSKIHVRIIQEHQFVTGFNLFGDSILVRFDCDVGIEAILQILFSTEIVIDGELAA